MLRFFSLALCFVASVASPLKKDAEESRIFNGDIAAEGQFPFAVSLQRYRKNENRHVHICTFSLITTKTCLGVAHCVFSKGRPVPPEAFCAIIGSNIQNNTVPCMKVARTHYHELYGYSKRTIYDLAVVVLQKEVTIGSTVQTVQLAGPRIKIDGKSVTALGWGLISDDAGLPTHLRYASMKVIDKCRCNNVSRNKLLDTQICVYGDGNHGTCGGDSGGPLLLKGTNLQIGAYSLDYEKECAPPRHPSVYTDVRKFIDWIKESSEGELKIVG